ncbi:hypothetical protein MMC17_008446 [Xylographa soralifera]|nr:hypothetical protein [Xylographa soralifera]
MHYLLLVLHWTLAITPLGVAQVFRRRYAHSFIGTWIYVDGGEISYDAGLVNVYNTTLAIDLSTDWTNETVNLVSTNKPNGSTTFNHQSLWWDQAQNFFFCYGGELTPNLKSTPATPPESIWGFSPDESGSGNWTEVVGPIGVLPYPLGMIRSAQGASASDSVRAYYLGGYGTTITSPEIILPWGDVRAVPGLQVFTFSSLDLINSSDGGYFASQYQNRSIYYPAGSMINVPNFGIDGLLIVLGGGSEYGNGGSAGGGYFNNITIYDKQGEVWYSQTAAGEIPEPRTEFCALGVRDQNSNTYEIFIHGGIINNILGAQSPTSDQVYILSLPAFHWFQANYTPMYSRAGHTCHQTGSSQMVVIGGLDPTETTVDLWNAFNGSADPWTNGLGVFDITSLQWKNSFSSQENPYTTPAMIKSYYDHNGSRYPSSWSSANLQALFQSNISENTTSNPTNPTNPTNSTSSLLPFPTALHADSPHISSGAIVGIVLGCIAPLLATASLIAWFFRDGKKRKCLSRSKNEMSRAKELPVSEPVHEMVAGNHACEPLRIMQPIEMPSAGEPTYIIEM